MSCVGDLAAALKKEVAALRRSFVEAQHLDSEQKRWDVQVSHSVTQCHQQEDVLGLL